MKKILNFVVVVLMMWQLQSCSIYSKQNVSLGNAQGSKVKIVSDIGETFYFNKLELKDGQYYGKSASNDKIIRIDTSSVAELYIKQKATISGVMKVYSLTTLSVREMVGKGKVILVNNRNRNYYDDIIDKEGQLFGVSKSSNDIQYTLIDESKFYSVYEINVTRTKLRTGWFIANIAHPLTFFIVVVGLAAMSSSSGF